MATAARGRRGDTGTPETLEGVIFFGTVAVGSHQAHAGPHLRLSDGAFARVYVVGDNPFENATLRPLEGRRVSLSGAWRNGVLRVEAGGIVTFPNEGAP